jgi:hypothetical protein
MNSYCGMMAAGATHQRNEQAHRQDLRCRHPHAPPGLRIIAGELRRFGLRLGDGCGIARLFGFRQHHAGIFGAEIHAGHRQRRLPRQHIEDGRDQGDAQP